MLGTTWARQSLCSASSVATSSRVRLTQANNLNLWMHWHRARMSSSSGTSVAVKGPAPAPSAGETTKGARTEKKDNKNEGSSKKPRRRNAKPKPLTLPALPVPDEAVMDLTAYLARRRRGTEIDPFKKLRPTILPGEFRELHPPIPLINVPKPVSLENLVTCMNSTELLGGEPAFNSAEEVPKKGEVENKQEGKNKQEERRGNRTRPRDKEVFKNFANPLDLRFEFLETVQKYLGSLYEEGHLTSPQFSPSSLSRTTKSAKADLLRAAYDELVDKQRYVTKPEKDFWSRFTVFRNAKRRSEQRRRMWLLKRRRKERKANKVVDPPNRTTLEMPSQGSPKS